MSMIFSGSFFSGPKAPVSWQPPTFLPSHYLFFFYLVTWFIQQHFQRKICFSSVTASMKFNKLGAVRSVQVQNQVPQWRPKLWLGLQRAQPPNERAMTSPSEWQTGKERWEDLTNHPPGRRRGEVSCSSQLIAPSESLHCWTWGSAGTLCPASPTENK